MPEYLIEDTWTGIKVPLEGPDEPSQAVAHKAIANEFNDLYTNLVSAPNGKFMLDVGPLMKLRELSDSIGELEDYLSGMDIPTMFDRAHAAVKNRMAIIDRVSAPDWSSPSIVDERGAMYKRFLDEELVKVRAENERLKAKLPSHQAKFRMLSNMPENSLLLIAHGREKGGLVTDWDHEFTLQNVAKIMGQNSNAVQNVYNAACYGGKCETKDYESAFPNVTNVHHAAFTNPNIISLGAMKSGQFFGTGTNVVNWEKWAKQNGQWNQITNVPTAVQ